MGASEGSSHDIYLERGMQTMPAPQFQRPGAFSTADTTINYTPNKDNLSAINAINQALVDAAGVQYTSLKDRLDTKDVTVAQNVSGISALQTAPLFPASYSIPLDGLTIGTFTIPAYNVTLGTVRLA